MSDPIYVPGFGNPFAKLMVILEAPGKHEEEQKKPAVGPTGKILDDLLLKAGSSRDDVYVTNVIKVRPPDNDLKRLKELGFKLDDFIPQLKEEIKAINPNCILAMGDIALTALTGNKGIKKWRGSILPRSEYIFPKVVPTLHPASIFKKEKWDTGNMLKWRDLAFIQLDVNRAVHESNTREIEVEEPNLEVAWNSQQLYRFLELYKDKEFGAYDIETRKSIPICISFAFNRYHGISVPMFPFESRGVPLITEHDLIDLLQLVAEELASKRKKLGQNFKFDRGRVESCWNMKINNFHVDLMDLWHTLYPEMYKSLAFQASIETRIPYYKDEGREYNPLKDDVKRLLLYNAKDATTTYACFEEEMKDLEEFA